MIARVALALVAATAATAATAAAQAAPPAPPDDPERAAEARSAFWDEVAHPGTRARHEQIADAIKPMSRFKSANDPCVCGHHWADHKDHRGDLHDIPKSKWPKGNTHSCLGAGPLRCKCTAFEWATPTPLANEEAK